MEEKRCIFVKYVLIDVSPMNRMFRVKISNAIGEIDKAFNGFQAQVASMCWWVLVQHYQRMRDVSHIDAANVDVFQIKLLACAVY